jgi:predicted ferric reductase
MEQLAGALTRATGLVAVALIAAALIWGFAFSAGETGRRLRPAWWLDLHNWLGGAALVFTVAHVVTALAVAQGPRIVAALVPFAAGTDRVALGVGAVATYLIAATVFTTWPRRIRSRHAWRVVHLGSVAAGVLAALHALQMGTDATAIAFQTGLVLLLAPFAYTSGVRLIGAATHSRRTGALHS